MDDRTLEILEFTKIRNHLTALVTTPLGKRLAETLRPGTVLESVRYDLRETTQMRTLWEINREPPLDGVKDLSEVIQRSRVPGAMLEPEELQDIGSTLEAVDRVRGSLHEVQDRAAHVSHYGTRLIPHPDVVERIDSIVDEFAQVRDGASPELGRKRRDIRELRAAIVRRLERLMRGALKEYLVESLYTLREDRYVLPVDTRYKNKVQGILHDRSSSGTTLYIEPMQVVQDGNRLKDLRREEEMEVRRILREVTKQIGGIADDLEQNQEIFGQLDFLGAKARLSIKYKMCEPKLESGNKIDLIQARHPLLIAHLGYDNVVPLDLKLEPPLYNLVISGPNTGGKTVVLKTIGLLCLMAQSGLHIPAKEGTVLPWFRGIGADIGDEQSLEQSLSTFSSHMTNIRELLKRAESGVLILLDELGSGTDPMEGGALATSILQELAESGATFAVTTHLDAVKVFAHGCDSTTNGAMDFDLESLSPTYNFRIGLPGRSNAIRIAQRLGLPPIVTERARRLHDDGGLQTEELLNRLSEEIKEAQAKRDLAAAEHAKAARLREDAKHQLRKAENQARDVIERGQRKAQGLLQELERRIAGLEDEERLFRETWRQRIEELVAQAKAKPAPESALTTIQDGLDAVRKELENKPKDRAVPESSGKDIPSSALVPGAHIKILGLSDTAEVNSYNSNRDEVEVVVNGMTIRVSRKRIDKILKEKKKEESDIPQVTYEAGQDVPMTLDIHGMTVEDAQPMVVRYLDRAFRAGHPYATICHGGGMGILRKMVRELAPKLNYVQNFRNGNDYEGGNGVTIFNFREDI